MMGERILPGSYFQYPVPGLNASPHRPPLPIDRERFNGLQSGNIGSYFAQLVMEKHKLGPFTQILPLCTRLLNQEIRRVTSFKPAFLDHKRFEHGSPLRSLGQHPIGRPMDMEGWSAMQTKLQENGHLLRAASIQDTPMGLPGLPGAGMQGVPNTTPIVKRVVRLDVPVDKYPNYNFVGRILGPRGNSLKRVEAMTECRVYIRGKGSVKDSVKEEKLKDKAGYEHLNEPLHVLLEAEFPEDMINSRLDYAVGILENLMKPVDESSDHYKKQQLKELALLNGTYREESPRMSPRMSLSLSPSMSPSMSPFNSTGMKRAKTGRSP